MEKYVLQILEYDIANLQISVHIYLDMRNCKNICRTDPDPDLDISPSECEM